MACPYCDSADWGYDMDCYGYGSPEVIEERDHWLTIRRRCECHDCGKKFVIHEDYSKGDWYQCLRLEDVE